MRPEINKLVKLSDWLQNLTIGAYTSTLTTNGADATEYLNSKSGVQIIVSRPELDFRNGLSCDYDAVIFILAKSLGNGRTEEKENKQYKDLLDVSSEIISKLIQATDEEACQSVLAGLSLSSYNIIPVTSIFGGWLGWSIDLNFE